MLGDEPLEIGDELLVTAEPQSGLEATLDAWSRSSSSRSRLVACEAARR